MSISESIVAIEALGLPQSIADAYRQPVGGLAGLGDSITVNGAGGTANLATGVIGSVNPRSWHMWACLLSGGRLRYAGIAATGGFTTQQIIDTHLPTMVAAVKSGRVSTVVVLAGTNDIGASVPLATIAANLTLIYKALIGAGARVVACTLTPRESAPGVADSATLRTALSRLNAWISMQRGVLVCDLHTPCVTPAGTWVSGLNGDNVHPNSAGAKAMGLALWSTLLAVTPVVNAPWLAATSESTGSTGYSQLGNPLMTDTDANGTPDGVTVSGSPTMSTNTTGTGLRGNYCKATATATATSLVGIGNSVAATVGQTVIFTARIRSSVEANAANCDWNIVSKPSDATVVAALIAWDRDVPDGAVLSLVTVLPSIGAETSIGAQMKLRAGIGASVEIAQVSLFNMTAAGLAA